MSIDPVEWLSMAFRFVHVVAGIMWVGNSIYFNWLDGTLLDNDPNKDGTGGDTWLIHGGGIYLVEKHRLDPKNFPPVLHWFKWESYTTWLSGFVLICLMYYSRGGFYMLGGGTPISGTTAVGIGLLTILGGFAVYDLLWRSPLKNNPGLNSAISLMLLMGLGYWLCSAFNGRAAFIHVGALLGTCMAGNVFFHIMPNQRRLVNTVKSGGEHSITHGAQAKLRSKHNNYMTFPVIFIMLSNHFPSVLGHSLNWLMLAVIIAGLALIKHFMNIRLRFNLWLLSAVLTFVAMVLLLIVIMGRQPPGPAASAAQHQGPIVTAAQHSDSTASAAHPNNPIDPETFRRGQQLFTRLACVTCHTAGPSQLGPSLVGKYNTMETFTDGTTAQVDEAYLRESILQPNAKIVAGFTPTMPPFEGVVEEDDLNVLIEYLKSL